MKMGLREANKQDKRDRLGRAARELFSEQGFESTTMRQIAERAGIGVGTIFLYARDKQGLLFLLFSDGVQEVQRQAFATLPGTQPSPPDGRGARSLASSHVPASASAMAKTPVADGSAPGSLLVDQLVHIFSSFYRFYDADRRLSRLFVKELLFLDAESPVGVRVGAGGAPVPPAAGSATDTGHRVSDAEKHMALTLEFIGRLSDLLRQAQSRGELRSDVDPLLSTMNFFATYFLTLVGLLDPIHGAHLTADVATQRLRMALQLQVVGLLPEPQPSPARATRGRRRKPEQDTPSSASRKRRNRS